MGLAPTPAIPQERTTSERTKAVRRALGPEGPNYVSALLFLLPAGLLLVVFLLYPTLYTILLSFNRGRNGVFGEWVGLDNYVRLFSDPTFLNLETFPPSGALWNNIIWIIFYTSAVVAIGLLIAVVTARVRYEAIIKAVVFIPMAIAATALAVIWKFVYAPDASIGLLNALLGVFSIPPISWLGDQGIVNASLIA